MAVCLLSGFLWFLLVPGRIPPPSLFYTPFNNSSITRLYGVYKEGEFVKIFDYEDFGYHRITVERPLKLNFAVTDERLELDRVY